MKDLEYIKKFSKISITKVCKELGINRGNLLSGRTTPENIKKVRDELERKVSKIYLEEVIEKNKDDELCQRK